MRYHSYKPAISFPIYGQVYHCKHPLYDSATLYLIDGKGLCLIQQRFDQESKRTYWGPVDGWLQNQIYLSQGFLEYFKQNAQLPQDGLYPTIPVRKVMWALRMKPLVKRRWETTFDRKFV